MSSKFAPSLVVPWKAVLRVRKPATMYERICGTDGRLNEGLKQW